MKSSIDKLDVILWSHEIRTNNKMSVLIREDMTDDNDVMIFMINLTISANIIQADSVSSNPKLPLIEMPKKKQ